jgi:hypothetical protein
MITLAMIHTRSRENIDYIINWHQYAISGSATSCSAAPPTWVFSRSRSKASGSAWWQVPDSSLREFSARS